MSKTVFRRPEAIGTNEWLVMPFGLKSVRATYQRVMNSIFHDFIGKFMKIYINDVVVKSESKESYLNDLETSFK